VTLLDQSFKDEVRSKNDIVEVISSYVKLEPRGNRYVGLCPFHGEKTPSFHVIPQMQIYHCFGCKASGDVFKFLQERDHLSFYEALVFLAKRARIPLPQEERTPEEEKTYRERRSMYDALDFAARFFHQQLSNEEGREGREYLLRRGLSEETLRHFRLGWAPGYGRMLRAMRARFPLDLLQKVGLIMPRREGDGYMDAFFGRVMFPITDLTGRVIGFGGRILEGNGPKYKNTSDTPLFTKRHVLYGLAQAKEAIRTQKQAVLVEGYMDVITPHQVGIGHVIAPLGTALTDEQCKLLRQQVEQVIVAFDTDTAGQMATLRGLEKLYETGCDVRILRLPEGKDPDEYIRTHGAEGFRAALDEAIPLVEFKLRRAMQQHPGDSPEATARAVDEVARVLVDLKNEVLRAEYVDRVVNLFAAASSGVPSEQLKLAIDRQMNRLLRQGFQHNHTDSRHNMRGLGSAHVTEPPQVVTRPESRPAIDRDRMVTSEDLTWKAERTLLLLLIQHPSLLSRVDEQLGSEPFGDEVLAAIHRKVRQAAVTAGLNPEVVVARLFEEMTETDAQLALSELVASPLVSVDWVQEAEDCIVKIEQHRVSKRIEDLEQVMKAKQAAGQRVEEAIQREYVQLQLQLKKRSKS
jgi:DNA primase